MYDTIFPQRSSQTFSIHYSIRRPKWQRKRERKKGRKARKILCLSEHLYWVIHWLESMVSTEPYPRLRACDAVGRGTGRGKGDGNGSLQRDQEPAWGDAGLISA